MEKWEAVKCTKYEKIPACNKGGQSQLYSIHAEELTIENTESRYKMRILPNKGIIAPRKT